MKKVALIRKEKFIVAKAKKKVDNAFAVIDDGNEITVIIDEEKTKKKKFVEVQKDYRIITFNMTLPFDMVGFISNVANSLAKKMVPIFVISAYSTDHILIKEEYIESAAQSLETLGFDVRNLK